MASIKKNFIYNTSYRILLLIIPIITTPYITRILGPDGIGIYAFSYSIASYFMMFVKMGLDNYGSRIIAESRDSKEKLSSAFSSVFYLQLSFGVVVSAAYIVYSQFIANDRTASWIFIIAVFSACADISWFLYGMELFKSIAIRSLVVKLITTICIFSFVNTKEHVYAYCLIMAIGMIINSLFTWPIVFKYTRFKSVDKKIIFSHIKPTLLLFLSVVSVNLYKTIDKVMLGIMDPSKIQTGLYESAERIITIPSIIVVSLGAVMMPRIVNMIHKNDSRYKEYIFFSIIFSMLIIASMACGIMGIAKEFVPMFYGDGYELCVKLYYILLPSCFFIAFANVLRTQYLIPHHKDKQYIISEVLGLILNLIANSILIPQLGAVGAAIGTLFAESSSCLYQCYVVRKDLPLIRYIKYSLPIVFSGFTMFLIILNLDFSVFGMSGLMIVLLKVAIGAIVFLALICLYGLLLRQKKDKNYATFINLIKKRKLEG